MQLNPWQLWQVSCQPALSMLFCAMDSRPLSKWHWHSPPGWNAFKALGLRDCKRWRECLFWLQPQPTKQVAREGLLCPRNQVTPSLAPRGKRKPGKAGYFFTSFGANSRMVANASPLILRIASAYVCSSQATQVRTHSDFHHLWGGYLWYPTLFWMVP